MPPMFELSCFAAILLLSLEQPLLWPFWIFLLLLATMLVIYAMTLGYVATSINFANRHSLKERLGHCQPPRAKRLKVLVLNI